MDPVGGAAGILHLVHQGVSHINQARRFEAEFRIYELHLQMHLSRCTTLSRIFHNTSRIANSLSINAIDDAHSISEDREPTAAEILSAVQATLREAQREAAQVGVDYLTQAQITGFVDRGRVQATKTIEAVKWAFYKRENCSKFIEEMSSIIDRLEHQVDREKRTLEEVKFVYMAGSWYLVLGGGRQWQTMI